MTVPKSDFNAAEIAAREMLLAMTGGTEDGFDSAVWLMSAMARTNPEDTVTVLIFASMLARFVANDLGISAAEVVDMSLEVIARNREA